mmetsp:Transcript_4925/g.12989  ORF Transcript_4925/g.12989 Transcript_4925/m.12989 type:complete len:186 (-) Transcript_4925:1027-1584(-)
MWRKCMRGPSLYDLRHAHAQLSQKQPTSIASGSAGGTGAPDLLLGGICPFCRYRGTVQYIPCAALTACTCTEQTILTNKGHMQCSRPPPRHRIDIYCSGGLQPQPNFSSFHARQPGGDELGMEMSGRLPSDIFVRIPPQPFDLILPATTSTRLPSVEDTLNDVSRLRPQFSRVSSVGLQRPHFNW